VYRFRNQEFFQIIYGITFFPDLAHKPQNQTNIATDPQEERVNTPETTLPYLK
jgi:hypothetical protein